MTEEEKTSKKLALAHRMLEASHSEVWQNAIFPYLERETQLQADLMASMTDALQLMRYAGAFQALRSLMRLEEKAKEVIEKAADAKLKKYKA